MKRLGLSIYVQITFHTIKSYLKFIKNKEEGKSTRTTNNFKEIIKSNKFNNV